MIAKLMIACCAVLLHTTAFALDFKGVRIGKPLLVSTQRAAFGKLDCNPMRMAPEEYESFIADVQSTLPGARQVCFADTSIATVPADVTVILGAYRKVLRLTFQFESEQYGRVVDAMSAKWGPGYSEVRDDADENVWWEFEDGNTVSVFLSPAENFGLGGEGVIGLAEYATPYVSPAGDL